MNQDKTSFYQVGGSLASNSPSYVERNADRELAKALKQGQFCYVLNSRQMGKSSLRVRAMSKLQAEGTVCIFIDLTGMGIQDLTAEKWYAGIVLSLVRSCRLEVNWRDWWREKRDLLSPVQRLGLFIEEVLLVEIKTNIVIFVDEIDRILSQKFSLDNFLALIHSCYQKRQVNLDYYRLTFTLLGVAAPQDLIRNKNQSPFELGQRINLEGFTLKTAFPLISGLVGKVARPQQILAEILTWTGGQPFLTQKLCQLILERHNQELNISQIIERDIVADWENKDEPEHLRTIRDRLCYRNFNTTIRLLGLYQKVLGKSVIFVNNSSEQIELRLSGLVVARQGKLNVSNPIYTSVFNLSWVERELAQLRPYSRAITNWNATNSSDYLLKGKDLQSALTWSLGKSLAELDYQFLVASQELAKQEAEDTLAAAEFASKLLATTRKNAERKVNKQRLNKKRLTKITLGVTGFILLLRCTGILQAWEWNLLDRFFRWRVINTAIEPRIVVVTIDERDINAVGQFPIPNRNLASAINKLKKYRPKAIALDLYRDLPVRSNRQDLQQIFSSTPNLYVVEKVIGEAIPPPPNIDRDRVGFADQVLDSDGKVRRALLSLAIDRQTRYSLATKLALHYLEDRQIKLKPLDNNRYRLGQAIFERFTPNSGGYIGADAGGYQILLNYWGTEANFEQYSLTEVLNEQITADKIRDRLVFIGSTAESIRDNFDTPYSRGWFRSPPKMPGVFIQANITSQIVSAAIDRRPLLHTCDRFVEFLWILLWGIIGIIIPRYWQSVVKIFLILVSTIILIVISYLAFKLGCWLPLIPALLTLTLTVITAIILRNRQRDRLRFQHTLKLLLAESQTYPIAGRIALEYFKQSENPTNSSIVAQKIEQLTPIRGQR